LQIEGDAMTESNYGDIRTVSPEEHWRHFAKTWRALKSYTYLGKTTPFLDAGVTTEAMPFRHDMRNSTGGITAGPLCVLAPEPWWRDDECVPAPVTMTYEVLDPGHDVTRLECVRDVISLGRTMGYSRSRVVDAHDHTRVIAISTGSGASLGGVPPGFYPVDNPVNEAPDSPDLPPLREVFGITRRPDGALVIDTVTPEIASPHSALHQGPINFALEAAAMDELERLLGTKDVQVEGYSVTFVKPGYVGPFVATATVTTPRGPRFGVEMTMRDEGADNRIIATAMAAFRQA
jgi:acyl-coenzyme A thioesterase PaaI-like protein